MAELPIIITISVLEDQCLCAEQGCCMFINVREAAEVEKMITIVSFIMQNKIIERLCNFHLAWRHPKQPVNLLLPGSLSGTTTQRGSFFLAVRNLFKGS